MKPTHKCDPARMALLYIRQQFICTTFKFDAYQTKVGGKVYSQKQKKNGY